MKNLMYTIISVIFLLFTPILTANTYAQGLIIDHNAVKNFDLIPDRWLDSAKTLTMHYGHTSHGMQIISGLKYIYENVDSEKYTISFSTFQHDPMLPPDNGGHRICSCGWHPEDYWASEEGRNEVRRFASSGLFDFSMFAFCGELAGSKDLTDYINEYLNTLNIFENEYPNMRFIYITGPSDGYPSYSKLRENNNMIRKYCRENNKILYDFADIENWDPDGNFYPNNYACSWCEDWVRDHPMPNLPAECNAGLHTCCPHTHGYNCYIKAKAYWYMMARLAGWVDPAPIDEDPGEYKGEVPIKNFLYQNYPNPFNPSTNIRFSLSKSEKVKIVIYDILGHKVTTLIENEKMPPGYHEVSFHANNLISGTYFYKIKAGNFEDSKKMNLIK